MHFKQDYSHNGYGMVWWEWVLNFCYTVSNKFTWIDPIRRRILHTILVTSNWVSFHYNPFAFYLMITFVVWHSLYHHTWFSTIFLEICLLIMDGVGGVVSYLKMMKFFHGLWSSWRFWVLSGFLKILGFKRFFWRFWVLSGSFTNENI